MPIPNGRDEDPARKGGTLGEIPHRQVNRGIPWKGMAPKPSRFSEEETRQNSPPLEDARGRFLGNRYEHSKNSL